MFSTSMSSIYVSLSLFNQGVYGCPFHVFSKSIPTRISTDPGHSTRIGCVFYPYFQGFIEGRSLLVVYVFTSPDSPRGPPWNEGHRPKVHHETSVLEVPAPGIIRTQFRLIHFIACSPYTVRRYRTSPGAPDLWTRLGGLQGSTRNGM